MMPSHRLTCQQSSTSGDLGVCDQQNVKKHIKLGVTDNGIVIRFAANPDDFDDQQTHQQNFSGDTVTVTYTLLPEGEWDRKVTHDHRVRGTTMTNNNAQRPTSACLSLAAA